MINVGSVILNFGQSHQDVLLGVSVRVPPGRVSPVNREDLNNCEWPYFLGQSLRLNEKEKVG